MTRLLLASPMGLLASLSLLFMNGCDRGAAPPPAAEKPKVEADLARTTLARDNYQALNIRSQMAKKGPVTEELRLSGWVAVRQGDEATVMAPINGYVRAKGTWPALGAEISQDAPLLELEPALAPLERLQLQQTQAQLMILRRGLEADQAKAEVSHKLARSELEVVEGLIRDKVKFEQDRRRAQALVDLAEADRQAAEAKLKLFDASIQGILQGRLEAVPLAAPRAGNLLAVHASPGQFVQAGMPLMTIADLRSLWLRVPIAERDLARVSATQPARVMIPTANAADAMFAIKPVTLVRQVDVAAHTADLLYDLSPVIQESKSPLLAKQQMVTVYVPLGTKREEHVVPEAAVVFDSHGGAWIYLERTPAASESKAPAEHVFERRRVELGPLLADGYIIRTPGLETYPVVVEGAGALYSREFHKPPTPTSHKPPT